jgi:Uncharacterized protein conserved in archaea
MTTHVGLTARALGADQVIFPDNATQSVETVTDIVTRFGGPFDVKRTDALNRVIREWSGTVVHLTMYGERVQDVTERIRDTCLHKESLLIIIGGEKVPSDVYEWADWNVAVTNQPHSEVAGLAVFLDRLFRGQELDEEWTDAEHVVIPQASGKRVVDTELTETESDEVNTESQSEKRF